MAACWPWSPGFQPRPDLPQPHCKLLSSCWPQAAARPAGEGSLCPVSCPRLPATQHLSLSTNLFPLVGGYQLCHHPGCQVQSGHSHLPSVARCPPGLGPQLRKQGGRSTVCSRHGQCPRSLGRLDEQVEWCWGSLGRLRQEDCSKDDIARPCHR